MQSLLPMIYHEYSRVLDSGLLACDASEWGKGVVHSSSVSDSLLRFHVSYLDRWRFGAGGSMATVRRTAVSFAFSSITECDLDDVTINLGDDVSLVIPEIPVSRIINLQSSERPYACYSLFGQKWRTVHSKHWEKG